MRVEPSSQPEVAIVVLNWNNPGDTLACLHSVEALAYPAERLAVIVVDNGSTDDSVARIGAAYPGAILVETGANLGYAGGNNAGIRHALAAGAGYICILNNDVVVAPDFLEPLRTCLEMQSNVGVVTPLITEQPDEACVWALGASVDWRTGQVARLYAGEQVSALSSRAPFEVEIAPGAAMLVRADVFQQGALMDERFFLYFEESDWSLHLAHLGFRIWAAPQSVVFHRVSATLGGSSPVIDYYMTRNQLHFIRRHWSGFQRWRLWLRTILRQLLVIAAYTVKSDHGRRTPHRDARCRGLWDAIGNRWGAI